MHEPTYRQAISHSWKLTWQHKYLWIFGLFAALLGQMGLMELLSRLSFFPSNLGLNWGWRDLVVSLTNLSLSVSGWTWLVWSMVIIGGLLLIGLFTALVSQGALIHASAVWAKKNSLPEPAKSWHVGAQNFWGLFILNFLKKVLLLIMAGLLSWFGFRYSFQASAVWSVPVFFLLFVLVAFFGMILSFLTIYAAGYVVVENYPVSWAIPKAWKLFSNHVLVSLEIGFLILGLNVLLGIVAVLGIFLISLPIYIIWFITYFASGNYFWILLSGMMPALFIFLVAWLGSLFTVFSTSIWTYLFVKMHKEGIFSRILHLFRKK